MRSSTVEAAAPAATAVCITGDELRVTLADGRTISVPIGWYPRLVHASPTELASWRLMDDGRGIHWAALDEDISVNELLGGQGSAESPASLQRWLADRR